MITSDSNKTDLVAPGAPCERLPSNSAEENTSGIASQSSGLETEEATYKRDTGTKLVVLHSSKKYTIVLDWKYSLKQYRELGEPLSDATTYI